MKCINKNKFLAGICTVAVVSGGCGSTAVIPNAYQPYQADFYQTSTTAGGSLFTDDLCVTSDINYGTEDTRSDLAEAAGVFNLKTREVAYSQNLFEKLYPASTTKILTAYIILSNCDLDDETTVSEQAVAQTSDSSVCGLRKGDVITVRDLLYGLLLQSGNDAAVVLAEYYSGSVEKFVKLMNRTAKRLGATGSHFTNPNGLPDEDHYTTVYDMYLIFQKAVGLDEFTDILSQKTYQAHFRHEDGSEAVQEWTNSNQYIAGLHDIPEGYEIVGGKTGTTNAAGYCLVLYSRNVKKEPVISIVFKGQDRGSLYEYMDEILKKFGQ